MLVGKVVYGGFTYIIKGYDFGTNIALYISSPTMDGIRLLDEGWLIEGDEDFGEAHYSASWDQLYLSIGSGNIKVTCLTTKEGNKVYKNRINKEFFSRLGSVISGMISACNNTNRKDILETMIGEYIPNKVISYRIENAGDVDLEMGVLTMLTYKGDDIEVELDDDCTYSERVVPLSNTSHKIKLDLSEFISKDEDDWDMSDGSDTVFSLQDIIERNPDKSYVWLKGRKYSIVKPDEVEGVCKEIWKHDGIVSFDTETTGLNFTFKCATGQGDRLVGMVFSIREGEAWYFPIAHKKVKNICSSNDEKYIIEKYFKPILEQKDLLCHNGSFDWKVMYVYNIVINLVHDTYILFKMTLWNDNRGLELGLKPLVKMYLGRDSFVLSDFVQGKWGQGDIKFWDLEEESVKYYACPDTDSALCLLNWALKQDLLGRYGANKIYQIEVLFSLVIAYQEYYGHCADVDRVDDLVKDIDGVMETEYANMVAICGHDFNPRSNKDLPRVMFEELKIPSLKKTDAGNPSTNKQVRKALMSEVNPDGSPKYPFVVSLNNYLISAQLKSNFTNKMDELATEDGFMFSSVTQFLETGRVSTSDPNYQSYNDTVKKYIIPRKGFYAGDADYSSVEARIMCSMAKCTNMVNRLKDPDADYHTLKASDMFSVPYELVTRQLRQMSKGVNFGILYGLGDYNLGVNLYGSGSPQNSIRAKKQKALYYTGMEELEGFITTSKEHGVRDNFSSTYFGRRRYFDPRKVRKDAIERQACNARIQGTAADIYKLAMVNMYTRIKNEGLMGKILISAFVHDECFLEIHNSLDPAKILKFIRDCMMIELDGWCPLFIGAGFGTNWYEAKKTEIPILLQEEIISTYGDSGFDWWNGNSRTLFNWTVEAIDIHNKGRVLDYLANEENYGKVLNPVINGIVHEVLGSLKAHGKKLDDMICAPNEINTGIDDTLENLKEFSRVFGVLDLFEKANIQKPKEHVQATTLDDDDDSDEYFEEKEVNTEEILKARIELLGVCVDTNSKGSIMYIKYEDSNPSLMSCIKKVIDLNSGSVEVIAIKPDGQYTTGMSTSMKAYSEIMKLYLTSKALAKK